LAAENQYTMFVSVKAYIRSLLVTGCLLITLHLGAQFAQQPPFLISIEPVPTVNAAAGFHSFAFAQIGPRWLVVGGRTNGLHGLNANDPFPTEFANNNIVVIDTTTWQIYTSNLSLLPKPVADPLRSTNMEYIQHGDYLYMVGGYGRDSVLNRFVTFPVISRIRVDSMMDAVVNNTSIQPYIKQVSDTNLRICGGELHYFDNRFYLVFGHDFNGRYTNPFAPIYTQVYSNSIKKFTIDEVAGSLQINNYSAVTDTNNFHRRDLNVLPLIQPNGAEALMAYAGVFQKTHDFPYFEPVFIDNSSYSVLSYTQVMSHYNCASLPVYDSITKKMHTVFFGGISFNDYDPSNNSITQDTLVPFVSDVTCFTLKPGNVCEEAVMPIQLPGLLGSNTKFVVNTNADWYANGVMNLNSLSGRTLAGYLFGGIRADSPNNGSLSVANDTVYRIIIEPDSTVSLKKIPEEFSFLDVFPNPAASKIYIRFQLKEVKDLSFSIYTMNGAKVKEIARQKYKKGTNNLAMDLEGLLPGMYFIQCISGSSVITKKIVVNP
jgi:hypothetical protein